MQAVHIKTDEFESDTEAAFIEMLIRFMDGVKDVATMRSMHIISVLYDEHIADAAQIIRALRNNGVRARRYRPAAERAARARQIEAQQTTHAIG
jgi:hypothetical protein